VKFKNFLLELGLGLVNSFKFTIQQMISINSLALEKPKKKETEEDDEEYDNDDEKDELQREIHFKMK